MEKLIWNIYYNDGCTWGVAASTPIEYSSKEDFILFLIDKIKSAEINKQLEMYFENEESFDIHYNSDFENNIFTLEEWFEKFKTKLI